MRCPKCGGSDFSDIDINLESDDLVHFHSCRFCESKWWERNGDPVDLNEVLTLTGSKRR